MVRSLSHVAGVRVLALMIGFAVFGACHLITTDPTRAWALIMVTGDLQGVPPNTPLKLPLVVLVVNQHGDEVKNISVQRVVVSGGGSLSADRSLSDDHGLASMGYSAGPTSGTVVVRAWVPWTAPVNFTVTIL